MKKIILLLILLPVTVSAQSVSISSPSFKAWGMATEFIEFSGEYENIGVHYFHNWDNSPLSYKGEKVIRQSSLALSYTFAYSVVQFGPMLFAKNFPVDKGTRVNFFVDVGYDFSNMRLSYRHVSNGFGVQNPVNPGLDTITLTIKL